MAEPRRRRREARPVGELDDVARSIIEQLQQDGRRSYAALGKIVGLSEAAARQRVRRLVETGVVTVVGIATPGQLGLTRQATIGIRAQGDVSALAEQVAELAPVVHVVVVAGSFDLLAQVVCVDDPDLLEVSNEIRELSGVTAIETFVHLHSEKRSYAWG